MKYALVIHEKSIEKESRREKEQFIVNFGNCMQWIAIEELYYYMHLDKSDIVELTSRELYTYKGEKLILPINYMMCDSSICVYTTEDKQFIFSEDIIPVFLGISVQKGNWSWTKERIEYFKKYEPIGCRDYLTWKTMTDFGIKAYLAGCLTATLPVRNRPKGDTVYFVEAPKALEQYIPDELKEKCKFVQQQLRVSEEDFDKNGLKLSRELLDEYNENAKVVITSRLHCALPCMALGIPVILVKEYFGYPFDLQKKFLPLYSYKDFNSINWNPKRVDLEQYKIIALDCAKKRLLGQPADNEIKRLHEEYIQLYKAGYVEEKMGMEVFVDKIQMMYKKTDEFNYALWGISDNAEWIHNYIQKNYPCAKLEKVIDNLRKIEFHGIVPEKADVLLEAENLLIIATTLNVSVDATPFFEKISNKSNRYISVTDGIIENF